MKRAIALLFSISAYWLSFPVNAIQYAVIHTQLGDIHIELYNQQAPLTVANFLRYVKSGHYDGGQFYRVVRADNDHGQPHISVVQGGAREGPKDFAPIPLETTHQSGLHHLDGSLSMARDTPASATNEFFICVGRQPALDFGGQRNPDGQGFAVFGPVIQGMQIVKMIQQRRDTRKVDDPYVQGQMLARPVKMLSVTMEKQPAALMTEQP